RGAGRGGAPPGRCHATRSAPSPASRSTRWLPANPAAPVTRISFAIVAWRQPLARHAAQRAVEGREVAQAGERERHEEAVIARIWQRRASAVVVGLVLERQAAALRVVERRDALLHQL